MRVPSTSVFSILSLPIFLVCPAFGQSGEDDRPNLVFIMTDEHNLMTLGCYRDQLPNSQAFIWGNGVKVDTPNIDSLARDGALFTNFYVQSPACTPSRASFWTGRYANEVGAGRNDLTLDKDAKTIGNILEEDGYDTAYVGKWHLNGDDKPGFVTDEEDARGFIHSHYMYNRGHWKYFEEKEDGTFYVNYNTPSGVESDENNYTTDFLFNRTIKVLEERDENKPFAILLNIPDPHGPNTVRAPYDTMYSDLPFEEPRTMKNREGNSRVIPGWESAMPDNRVNKFNSDPMATYFGMVKCIDDNLGKLLEYIDEKGLTDNTIVVFTSDHGDMLFEHGRKNKGMPYKTSGGVPFIVRYPGKILPGKVINSVYSSMDAIPSVLGLMGVTAQNVTFSGKDKSSKWENQRMEITDNRNIYMYEQDGKWSALIDHQGLLVVSSYDQPWYFYFSRDSDEVANYYPNLKNSKFIKAMINTLQSTMIEHNDPSLFGNFTVNTPVLGDDSCNDHKGKVIIKGEGKSCMYVASYLQYCSLTHVLKFCEATCGRCTGEFQTIHCIDSAKEIVVESENLLCLDIDPESNICQDSEAMLECPNTCKVCPFTNTLAPTITMAPTTMIPTISESPTESL